MGKKLKSMNWSTVPVEGFPMNANDLQGFVGLEECTDYGDDIQQKKIKSAKKHKEKPSKKNPNTELSLKVKPTKKVEQSGFTVETVGKEKPHLSTTTQKSKATLKNSTEDKDKPPIAKKIKQKLGVNKVEEESKLSLEDMQAWSSMQIPEEILKALAEQGFRIPTKIQELTLPSAMLGRRDILGAAQTGSGKTLAFGIPILTGIMKLKEKQEAGIDVYDMVYKKSSMKKPKLDKPKVDIKKKKNNKNAKRRNVDSSEEGYSSDNDEKISDNEKLSDDESISGKEESEEEYLEEYDVPIEKKTEELSADEGNDTDDDGYIHLSEILDDDNNSDSNDDDDIVVENDDSDGSSSDTDSQDEYNGDEEDTGEGIGCVKVIDNVEIPGHVITKTGKPLYALILTPTRELAMQISQHLISAAKYTGIRIATIVGGMAAVKQERLLSKSPEIVVATPGRLWELMRQGQEHLQQVDSIKFLAIDETDRMVERNHFLELHPLLERLNSDEVKRKSRQNFVFSATLTMVHDLPTHMQGNKVTKRGKIINRKIKKMTPEQKLKKLINMIGMTEPKVVDITSNLGTADTLTQCRISCSIEQKDYYLYYILRSHPGRTIVFCNSIGSVKRLSQLFSLLKCKPLPLHASMPQRQRLKNLERFRDDPNGVLVATDVAARGLDIPNVDHVIHYQVPRTAENYVHRSGRTARANKEGLTILMMEPGEAFTYTKLCRTLNMKSELPTFPVPPHTLTSMKDVVCLARDLERLSLSQRRGAQETGWLEKAAREMDMIVDGDFVSVKPQNDGSNKLLQIKKKQLEQLLSKPVFPRGFSFKYPTLNDPTSLMKTEENALQVMKKALNTGEIKREKRKSKNDPLLKLAKKLKSKE